MSLLNIGALCASCHLNDFLPISCPHCKVVFCKDHILSHSCDSDAPSTTKREVKPSTWVREKCFFGGCRNPTVESIAGWSSASTPGGVEAEGGIAREVKCPQCSHAFCTEYVIPCP